MPEIQGIDNTLKNRPLFNTSAEAQIRSAPMASTYRANQGTIVSFECDVREMFGITLDYPGIRQAINRAWAESRQYVPVDTGLLRKSYAVRVLSDTMVELYFDPLKIVGMIRKRREVEEYYPQWVGSSGPDNRAWNWLTIVMSHFFDALTSEVRALMKRDEYKERKAEGRSVPEPTQRLKSSIALLHQQKVAIIEDRIRARKEKRARELEEIERQKRLRALVRRRKEERE